MTKIYPIHPEVVLSLGAVGEMKEIPEIKLTYKRTGKEHFGKVTSSKDAANFIRELFEDGTIELQEHFYVLFLNRSNRIIGHYRHTIGGATGVVVDTKIILGAALNCLAQGLILAHNHPSGNLQASDADIKLTKNFKEACKIMEITLFDHLIITTDSYYSFADEGMLNGIDKPVHDKANPLVKNKNSKTFDVEKISDEVRFIKRFVLIDGKEKNKKDILAFINSLQKSILERRIRKTSKYATEITYIQDSLVNLYNKMARRNSIIVSIDKQVLKKFTDVAGSEKTRLSINYLKRYVGIQGKKMDKEKAQRLLILLENAAKNKKITKDDPYALRLQNIYKSLHHFINNAKPSETLEVHENILNGINEVLEGCHCENLNGIESKEDLKSNPIMNSMDFTSIEFERMGIKEPWLSFMGDVSPGFTAMIFGKPKMGKSYLAVDMAGYFAQNHGKVLYVAREEGLNTTLQDKLKDKSVAHSMLDVTGTLPNELGKYSFVFLDSVNSLGLTPLELRELKKQYPTISFFFIFQTTKEGNFRGANEFQHDVDVVIEVPEKGRAVQFGRFNQGGELNIFQGA